MGREIEWVDHLGNAFPSFKLMCEYWGKSDKVVGYRIKHQKWSVEKALTTPIRAVKKTRSNTEVTVHGVTYPSLKEACNVLNKNYRTINGRLKNHTIDEAFDDEFNSLPFSKGEVVDPWGIPHVSFSAMCKYYGLTDSIVRSRVAHGMSLAEALTKPSNPNRKEVEVPGVGKFDSLEKALNACGISRATYLKRIDMGMTQAEALTKPAATAGRKLSIPGYGDFKSLREACNKLGIGYTQIELKIIHNKTTPEQELLEILNGLREIESRPIEVFNRRLTVKDASSIFGIGIYEFCGRLAKCKIDIEASAVIPPSNPDGIKFRFKGVSGKGWYSINGHTGYIDTKGIIGKYKPELLQTYELSNPSGRYHPINL